MKRALLDTSFVISLARGEEMVLEDPPEEAAISAVTLCGLHHGVRAPTDEQRPGRLATLIFAERRFAALPIDTRVAPHYGRLIAETRRRRGKKLQRLTLSSPQPQPPTNSRSSHATATSYTSVASMRSSPAPDRAQANLVHFTPSARTAWHTHPLGQTIYVTEGTGLWGL